MPHLELDYSDLRDTSQQARNVAKAMSTYADRISPKINTPLGSLSGGQTGYTSTAATLATQKANKLREQAGKYERFASKVDTFANNAQQADRNLRQKLAVIKNENYKNLAWYQKVALCLESFYHHTIGRSKLGRFLNTIHRTNRLGLEMATTAMQKVRDWFAYGNGRYVANIALGVLAVVGAVAAVVVAVAAAPVTIAAAIAAAVVLVASVVGLAITSMQFIATAADNVDAIATSESDPGRARYLGGTKDLSSYTKKHVHNKDVQNLAKGLDITNTVCKVISAVGNLAGVKDAAGNVVYSGGERVVDYSLSNLSKNFVAKYSPKEFLRGFVGFKSFKPDEGASTLVNVANGMSNMAKNTKSAIKWTQDAVDISRLGYISQDGVTNMLKRIPNVEMVYDAANSYYDSRELITKQSNPLKPHNVNIPSHTSALQSTTKSIESVCGVINSNYKAFSPALKAIHGPFTPGALVLAPGGPQMQALLGSTIGATNYMIGRHILNSTSTGGMGGR